MENCPFIDDFPIKTSIYKGFSIAMLNNQMVYTIPWWPNSSTYCSLPSSKQAVCYGCQGTCCSMICRFKPCWFPFRKLLVYQRGTHFVITSVIRLPSVHIHIYIRIHILRVIYGYIQYMYNIYQSKYMNTLQYSMYIYIYYVDLLDCTKFLALTSLPLRSTSADRTVGYEDSVRVDDLGVPEIGGVFQNGGFIMGNPMKIPHKMVSPNMMFVGL